MFDDIDLSQIGSGFEGDVNYYPDWGSLYSGIDLSSYDSGPGAINISLPSTDFSFDLFNDPAGSGLFDVSGNLSLSQAKQLLDNPELFEEFKNFDPESAAILEGILVRDIDDATIDPRLEGISARDIDDATIGTTIDPRLEGILARDIDDATLTSDAASAGKYNPDHQSAAETARLQRQAGNEGDGSLKAQGVPVGDPDDPTGTRKLGITSDASKKPDSIIKQVADKLGIKEDELSKLAKLGLAGLASYLSYKSAKDAQTQARGASFKSSAPVTATRTAYKGTKYSAAGGLASLAEGGKTSLPPRYLDGHTDGMADNVPAHIDRKRPAALSDGEFVIPADVVSHLGNGNSNAGAKRLYEMMDRIRSARTGNSKQGKQINPNRFLPR